MLHENHQTTNQAEDDDLRERALFVEGIQHLHIESRRLVETANRVVKQDVGVLEEPRRQYHRHRNAHEA